MLGGGGAAGNAWIVGVVAGLAAEGVDLTRMSAPVIGTSAGATAAAQLTSGASAADLFGSAVTPAPRADRGRQAPPAVPMSEVVARIRAISDSATSALALQRAMGAFALECDAALAAGAEARRAVVAARLPSARWPERPVLIAALDARTGALIVLDRDSGVDLVVAVLASTAMPGLAATVAAAGHDCIDGGVRSTDNADLAAGATDVLVLSPLGARSGAPQPARFEGLRRSAAWGTDLAGQVAGLRATGSRVTVLTPDADADAAMGHDLTDAAVRPASARAGFEQGRAAASALERFTP